MKFKIKIPKGWEVVNLNDVAMASKLTMLFASKISSEWALTLVRRNLK